MLYDSWCSPSTSRETMKSGANDLLPGFVMPADFG